MNFFDQDTYTRAWNFACRAHGNQKVPGTELPYCNHLGNVVMEVTAALMSGEDVGAPDLLVQCALLHDVIEDTDATYEAVCEKFGKGVADGVAALSKNIKLPTKREQIQESIARIKSQPREISMVKLADRITNLQPPPPHWTREKIAAYREEAGIILKELGGASKFLAKRLAEKIAVYGK